MDLSSLLWLLLILSTGKSKVHSIPMASSMMPMTIDSIFDMAHSSSG